MRPLCCLPRNASNQDRLRVTRLKRLVSGTVHDKFPIVSVPGGKTNHRTVDGGRMYVLFIIQFVRAIWAKADRSTMPRRIRRPDRQVSRSSGNILRGTAFLSCIGWVNSLRAKYGGPVLSARGPVPSAGGFGLSALGSLAVALLSGMRLAIFRRLGPCEIRSRVSRHSFLERLFGSDLVPCPAHHPRAESRAVIRSSRLSANASPLDRSGCASRIDWA
jgi:hypothetical protein